MLADVLVRGVALAWDSFCLCNFLCLGNWFKLVPLLGRRAVRDGSLAADPSEVQKSP